VLRSLGQHHFVWNRGDDAAKKGLLGFAVERFDPKKGERFTMPGFKVFKSVIPNPTPHVQVSTTDHPVQSFLWDDFTAEPDHVYEYSFQPLRGKPKNLDRSAKPIPIKVRTEPLFTKKDHDVFFNRGVASSQAYERNFGNNKPDDLTPASKRQEALDFLTRDLDEAIAKFIASAGKNDTLLCCFYEFRHEPVVKALAAARKKIKNLQIIIDAKVNEYTDKNGKFHASFPRKENLNAISDENIPDSSIIKRERNPNDIQHNKFMVLLKGASQTPTDVWTGSTNISLGGFTGQTNVGHWVRGDKATAAAFKAHWDLLATDPGSTKKDDKATAAKKRKAFRTAVEALQPAPTTSPRSRLARLLVFSPRSGSSVLDLYVDPWIRPMVSRAITLRLRRQRALQDTAETTPRRATSHFFLERRTSRARTARSRSSPSMHHRTSTRPGARSSPPPCISGHAKPTRGSSSSTRTSPTYTPSSCFGIRSGPIRSW
jgi:hypothetical protein